MLVVDKPGGWTSHQVVGRVRRLLGTRKVGHAGTLDPMATGVLVVGVGRATRLLGHLAAGDKAYTATVRLGIDTVTDDAEGEPTAIRGAAGVDPERVVAALPGFTGPILQRPSAVSAIKVDGVRSYARVRSGEEVELAARPVTVSAFVLERTRPTEVDGVAVLDCDVRVECSAGTYVRALARDLGALLGTGGHLTALRRTRVGRFGLDEAVVLPGRDDPDPEPPPLLGLREAAGRVFPTVRLDPETSRQVLFGRRLPGLRLADDPTALLGPDGELLALYRPDGPDAVPLSVFVAPA
ncbi:tRNA pseudouridine55 synthase [Friedmanniella endophytica]|uniref:tRNA pseudouridine synthase B n=1 Tax=Microlunatus kandeliicorticis TaxID=1759536 RepID=A0A7W3IW51_9ACTN|nr:tRNA pseudouridine(55) synthase TruB [Microlunatus kandeliicorticis]MBA8796280.1 tRNA pseudouridine55 synthase [Microlunatus kandeliicorticis]